ncbi:MAG TPA: PEP-CTERM sorting domain-containing protein [Isosphaeraceae bacterium]|jgi:hypothetical protein
MCDPGIASRIAPIVRLASLALLGLLVPAPAWGSPMIYVSDFHPNPTFLGVHRFDGTTGAEPTPEPFINHGSPEKSMIIGETLYLGSLANGAIPRYDKNTGAFQGFITGGTVLGGAPARDGSALYVASGTVRKLDPATGAVTAETTPPFNVPWGVATEANGNLLVTTGWMGGGSAVYRYDPNLNLLGTVVPPGTVPGFDFAAGITVANDGSFYVTQSGAFHSGFGTPNTVVDHIFHFGPGGNLIADITDVANGLNGTFDVAIGPDGNLYATVGGSDFTTGDFHILRFNTATDTFMDVFASDPNIALAKTITFDFQVAAVPEPSSLALAGIGLVLGGLAWRRRTAR